MSNVDIAASWIEKRGAPDTAEKLAECLDLFQETFMECREEEMRRLREGAFALTSGLMQVVDILLPHVSDADRAAFIPQIEVLRRAIAAAMSEPLRSAVRSDTGEGQGEKR